MSPPKELVQLSSDGKHFQVGEKPWLFLGTNCYQLMQDASDEGTKSRVTEVLDSCAKVGLTAIRMWAFNDGDNYGSLQPEAGKFDEEVFKGLDWVVSEAGKRGIRLMLTFINYWQDYGGMAQYREWAANKRGKTLKKPKADKFYEDEDAQDLYRNFIKTLLERKNTVTGMIYKDDPIILAWELVNEPRAKKDESGDKLTAWCKSTAAFVKSIDSKHLLTLGHEGWFGKSTEDKLDYNPFDAVMQGGDFQRNHDMKDIDFATIHIYAGDWMGGETSDDDRADFSQNWIKSHVEICNEIGKPLVVTEYGVQVTKGGDVRLKHFGQMLDCIKEAAQDNSYIAGSLFWAVAARDYPGDAFVIYLSPETDDNSRDDSDYVHLLKKHIKALDSLNEKLEG